MTVTGDGSGRFLEQGEERLGVRQRRQRAPRRLGPERLDRVLTARHRDRSRADRPGARHVVGRVTDDEDPLQLDRAAIGRDGERASCDIGPVADRVGEGAPLEEIDQAVVRQLRPRAGGRVPRQQIQPDVRALGTRVLEDGADSCQHPTPTARHHRALIFREFSDHSHW